MQDRDRLYIDGAWVPSTGKGSIDVISASTEEVIGRIPEGTADDVDKAVKAAKAAFPGWSETPVEERAKYLTRLQEGLSARMGDIANTICAEVGMPMNLSMMIQAGLPIMSAGSQANPDATYPDFFKPDVANKKLKLLWMGIGKDDNLVGPSAKTLDDALTKANIKHTFQVGEGRHEWVVWRHHLRDVAPLLFKPAGASTSTATR